MSGSLFDLIKRDAKQIINSGGYQVNIELTTPDNTQVINITGWAVKHHISFDSDGNQVNTKTVRATIDEDVLKNLNYPFRNAKNEIRLISHKLSFADSSGEVKNYIVRENFPDENLGLISLLLGDYKN
jgi:hypothetical protein